MERNIQNLHDASCIDYTLTMQLFIYTSKLTVGSHGPKEVYNSMKVTMLLRHIFDFLDFLFDK